MKTIYMVGEKVVLRSDFHGFAGILTVYDPCEEVCGVCMTEDGAGRMYGYSQDKYRHAKPEEIKANKRLF